LSGLFVIEDLSLGRYFKFHVESGIFSYFILLKFSKQSLFGLPYGHPVSMAENFCRSDCLWNARSSSGTGRLSLMAIIDSYDMRIKRDINPIHCIDTK
jgi:hypothetical protein